MYLAEWSRFREHALQHGFRQINIGPLVQKPQYQRVMPGGGGGRGSAMLLSEFRAWLMRVLQLFEIENKCRFFEKKSGSFDDTLACGRLLRGTYGMAFPSGTAGFYKNFLQLSLAM